MVEGTLDVAALDASALAEPALDAAAAGQRADSVPRKKRESRNLQRAREPSYRIGVSCPAFSSLLSPFPAASYMRCGCRCESESSSDCTGDGKSLSGSKFCNTS